MDAVGGLGAEQTGSAIKIDHLNEENLPPMEARCRSSFSFVAAFSFHATDAGGPDLYCSFH
jgi:hypothetical protein